MLPQLHTLNLALAIDAVGSNDVIKPISLLITLYSLRKGYNKNDVSVEGNSLELWPWPLTDSDYFVTRINLRTSSLDAMQNLPFDQTSSVMWSA